MTALVLPVSCMAVGFVLVKIGPRCEMKSLEFLRHAEQIEDVYMCFGEYDIILKVRTDTIDDIAEVVVKKVRSIRGVLDTKTLVSTRSLTGE